MNTVHGDWRIERDALARPRSPVSVLLLAALVTFCLSTISLAGATAVRLASILGTRLSGQVTIVVWGRDLESADAAAARAAERLSAQAGVRATVLEADKSDPTAGELIAGGVLHADGPRLLSLSGAPDAIPSAARLKGALEADRLLTAIDDHRRAMGPSETLALLGGGFAVMLGLVLTVCLFVLGWVNGSRGVGAARARFDLLTRLGADPTYIGVIVGQGSGMMALIGGVMGTLCADIMVFTAMVDHGFWQALRAPTYIQPQPRDGLWTVGWPLIVAVIAALGAGFGARRVMVRLERET